MSRVYVYAGSVARVKKWWHNGDSSNICLYQKLGLLYPAACISPKVNCVRARHQAPILDVCSVQSVDSKILLVPYVCSVRSVESMILLVPYV